MDYLRINTTTNDNLVKIMGPINALSILIATTPLISCLPNPPVQHFVPRGMIPTKRYHPHEHNVYSLLCCGKSDVDEDRPLVHLLHLVNPSPHSDRRADGACSHGLITVRVCSSFLCSGCRLAIRSFVVLSHPRFSELLKCNTEPPDVTKKEDGEIPLFLSHAVLGALQLRGIIVSRGRPENKWVVCWCVREIGRAHV